MSLFISVSLGWVLSAATSADCARHERDLGALLACLYPPKSTAAIWPPAPLLSERSREYLDLTSWDRQRPQASIEQARLLSQTPTRALVALSLRALSAPRCLTVRTQTWQKDAQGRWRLLHFPVLHLAAQRAAAEDPGLLPGILDTWAALDPDAMDALALRAQSVQLFEQLSEARQTAQARTFPEGRRPFAMPDPARVDRFLRADENALPRVARRMIELNGTDHAALLAAARALDNPEEVYASLPRDACTRDEVAAVVLARSTDARSLLTFFRALVAPSDELTLLAALGLARWPSRELVEFVAAQTPALQRALPEGKAWRVEPLIQGLIVSGAHSAAAEWMAWLQRQKVEPELLLALEAQLSHARTPAAARPSGKTTKPGHP